MNGKSVKIYFSGISVIQSVKSQFILPYKQFDVLLTTQSSCVLVFFAFGWGVFWLGGLVWVFLSHEIVQLCRATMVTALLSGR